MEKFVKIPLKYYLQLEQESLDLCFLESCGVDNWEPGISHDDWAKEQGNSCWEDLVVTEERINYDIIEE
jgi:hypothetical protein